MIISKVTIIVILSIIVFSIPAFAQDIHKAVEAGDFAKVKMLIEKNPELIKTIDSEGETPLHLAIWEGHDEIAKLLLSMIKDVNLKNARGNTLLLYTAYQGRKNIAELLLKRGALVDQKNIYGRYPVHYAAREGHKGVLELLIENGANINVKSDEGLTPLEWALDQRDKSVIDLLLVHKAELHAKSEKGIRMLHRAAVLGYKMLVDRLISQGVNIHSKDARGGNLLHNAATGGLLDLISFMISQRTDINMLDMYGSTPLHEAAAFGKKGAVELLIKNGADINSKRPDGSTPLHVASEAGRENIVDVLIAKGAVNSPKQFPLLQGEYLGQKPPGMKPELFAPGILSTSVDEALYHYMDGGKIFIFSRPSPHNPETYLTYITELKDGKWTEPYQFPLKDKPWYYNYTVAPVGKTVYFTSPLSPDGSVQLQDWNIWITKKTAEGWSKPRMLEAPVSSDKRDVCPSVTKDGTIYFFSDRAGGFGPGDIYRARLVNGKYTEVENLGEVVNTEYDEIDVSIAFDESYLIFQSNRPGRFGKYDLYCTFRNQDDTWTVPVNMGKDINTSATDDRPYITPDGKYFFFGSHKSGNLDMYWVDAKIIEDLKPKKLN
ncbi:MAG: ankyrin repeat domain-containing protein [Desulfobacterales bacterium]